MACHPREVWQKLSSNHKKEIITELLYICLEVTHEYIRINNSSTLNIEGNDLHSTINLHQTLSNQESLKLQYALKQRALELGWQEDHIEIIDIDLGLTGAEAKHREGFKSLLTQVALGE